MSPSDTGNASSWRRRPSDSSALFSGSSWCALDILDAQTLEDVATIKLPHRVPSGFHGNWVPSTG
ncbi:carotenoid oxygenase [Mycobacteroides abscessus]|nr:carotenoid oxygenase family protein [Mycobacteroides abscessus]PVA22206.1 carotenoid oxygenase [Mycobacteroides abscessus]PVA87182.1 carotenoid oxygenase [Mycobacteroides abscessus]RIR85309.1 carotenoid oxygenase [Mycobacteroides abscessus]RIS04277.1 carotenoid oxygenase [Mycobacteroides abscessus]RIS16136.1 carotenoid oxygenase [Mycobacteroides abscessus]